jgi:hypothetical protein
MTNFRRASLAFFHTDDSLNNILASYLIFRKSRAYTGIYACIEVSWMSFLTLGRRDRISSADQPIAPIVLKLIASNPLSRSAWQYKESCLKYLPLAQAFIGR